MVLPEECLHASLFLGDWEEWSCLDGIQSGFFSSSLPKSLLECPIRQQSALRSVSDRPSSAPAAAADQCEVSPATGASPVTALKLWLQIILKIRYGGAPENKGAIWLQKGRKALRLSLLTQIFEALAAAPGGKLGLLQPLYCGGVNHSR